MCASDTSISFLTNEVIIFSIGNSRLYNFNLLLFSISNCVSRNACSKILAACGALETMKRVCLLLFFSKSSRLDSSNNMPLSIIPTSSAKSCISDNI